MKIKNKKYNFLTHLLFLLVAPLLTKTQVNASTDLSIDNPLSSGVDDIPTLLQTVTNYILTISGTLMVIVLIIAGIRYLTAGANANRAQQAKTMLKWAILGIVIVLGAFAIINTIVAALGGTST